MKKSVSAAYLGEDAQDKLSHYICCDPLWTAAISCSFNRLELLHQPPLNRLCLVSPSLMGARLLCIVYGCYHSIKLGHRGMVDDCVDDAEFEPVLTKLVAVADAFAKDIVG